MTKAFDLALFVGTPTNVGDGVVVSAVGPPLTTQFAPVPTAGAPGVVVGASVPKATAAGQTLVAGAGPGFAWTPGASAGGIADAPNDATAYARKSLAWSHVTHNDIADWSATLGPDALTANVPVASSTPPAMDSSAAAGTASTFARADHVHPTDTSRYSVANPAGYQTASDVSGAIAAGAYTLPIASTSVLGGVKVDGSTIHIAAGVISSSGGGIADAPATGTTYGRNNNAWVAVSGGGGGGITDAPADGTSYARNNSAWAHLTHADITDWAATLAPYALTAGLPAASSAAPTMDGTAAPGVAAAWSRGDHVHPTDTSRYAASNPNGFITSAGVPAASSTTPVMDGTAAVGVGGAWARGDHVHPSDTSRYAASNPSGFQTAAQVTASISAAAYVLPTASLTTLGGVKVDGSTITISGGVISSTAAYTLPTASTTVLGGVKVDGTSISIAAGVISASGATPSSAAPAMDGTAAAGVATTYARGDHVHPTDTSRYAATNPNGYQTAAQVTAAVPAASSTTPAMDGAAAIGTGVAFARNDHVHPTDTSRAPVIGVVNASNAAAGQVGEFVTAQQLTAQGLTTATAINLSSISLTAGDWDVDGDVFYAASGVNVSNFVCSVGLTSATIAAVGTPGRAQMIGAASAFAQSSFSTGRLRVNVSATTTVYLVASATFTTGTCTVQGTIQARRMR